MLLLHTTLTTAHIDRSIYRSCIRTTMDEINHNQNIEDSGDNRIDEDTATENSEPGVSDDDISDVHRNESQLPTSQQWTDADSDEHSACIESDSKLGAINDCNNGISVPLVSRNEKKLNTVNDVDDGKNGVSVAIDSIIEKKRNTVNNFNDVNDEKKMFRFLGLQ